MRARKATIAFRESLTTTGAFFESNAGVSVAPDIGRGAPLPDDRPLYTGLGVVPGVAGDVALTTARKAGCVRIDFSKSVPGFAGAVRLVMGGTFQWRSGSVRAGGDGTSCGQPAGSQMVDI